MNRPMPTAAHVKALPLGDSGFALLGGGLAVDPDQETGDLVFKLVALGGRMSEIVGLTPMQVTLRELGRVSRADVVAALVAKEQEIAGAALAGMPRSQE